MDTLRFVNTKTLSIARFLDYDATQKMHLGLPNLLNHLYDFNVSG